MSVWKTVFDFIETNNITFGVADRIPTTLHLASPTGSQHYRERERERERDRDRETERQRETETETERERERERQRETERETETETEVTGGCVGVCS